MKVPEIKQKLNELGVEYDDNLTKPELLDLLEKEQSKAESNSQSPEDEQKEQKETKSELELQDDLKALESKRYVVIHDFKDLKDNNTIYIKGDIYPRRADSEIDEARVQELVSDKNKIGKPLIKEQD